MQKLYLQHLIVSVPKKKRRAIGASVQNCFPTYCVNVTIKPILNKLRHSFTYPGVLGASRVLTVRCVVTRDSKPGGLSLN